MEAQYLADVAKSRWPVLVFVIAFDVGCYILRFGAKLLASKVRAVQLGPTQRTFLRVLSKSWLALQLAPLTIGRSEHVLQGQ